MQFVGKPQVRSNRMEAMTLERKSANPIRRLLALWAHHPLYIHIATLFTLLVFIAGTVIGWSNYFQAQNMMFSAAEDVFERMQRESIGELERLRAPAEAVVDWVSTAPVTDAETLDARMPSLPAMVKVLEKQASLAAIYVGYFNGDFFLVRALRDAADRSLFRAPRHAAYLVQSMEQDGRKPHFIMLDSALNEISSTTPADYTYDPRTRNWYAEALKTAEQVHTAPYLFFTTKEVGITIARRAEHGRAVVGVDIRLTRISETLAKARMTPSSQLAIFNADNHVIAYSDPLKLAAMDAAGALKPLRFAELSPVLAAVAANPQSFSSSRMHEAGDRDWLVKVAPLTQGAAAERLAIAVPRDELLTRANELLERGAWLTLLLILLALPVTWLTSRRVAGNLRALTDQAEAVQRFDFSSKIEVRTRINEIYGLGGAMTQMRETLRKFLDITTALFAERDFDRLLQRLLKEAREAVGGAGAMVYLLDEDGPTLKCAAQQWQRGSVREVSDLPVENRANPAAALCTQVVPPLSPQVLEFLDTQFGHAAVTMTTVPLPTRAGEIIGVMCLFFSASAQQPLPDRMALVNALAGVGAAAIDNLRRRPAQARIGN
jgi:HAMP domain-containing protein